MKNSCFFPALLILLFNNITQICSGSAILNSATDKHALLSFKTSLARIRPECYLDQELVPRHTRLQLDWCVVRPQAPQGHGPRSLWIRPCWTVSPYLGNLTFLTYLGISSNNFTGFLPLQLSKLRRRLKVVSVAINSFAGEVPTWLGSLPQLEKLYLNNNSFSGRIPPSLFNSSKLRVLSMRSNLVGGNIPEEIGNASSLEILYLSRNQLSGSVPRGLFNITWMKDIRIAYNNLSGLLPGDLCNDFPNLEILTLSMNQLSGEIPGNIWKCRDLEILSLSYNSISGSIPSEIGNMSMLRVLYLSTNNLQGSLRT